MSIDANILVATDIPSDGEVVREMLEAEFSSIHLSTNPDDAASDFEACKPEVLVLAFNALEKAEHYYLILNRLSAFISTHVYRTVLLCEMKDLQKVYKLCKKSIFDDYVLFWPIGHDITRLPMAIHHALASLGEMRDDQPTARELAAQARQIADLEARLQEMCEQGEQHTERASGSLSAARQGITLDIDAFADNLATHQHSKVIEILDQAGFRKEVNNLKRDLMTNRVDPISAAVDPVRAWSRSLRTSLEPELESVRVLASMADQVTPTIMVIDDDQFQHNIVKRIFEGEKLELMFASSAAEAFAFFRNDKVDLILLDVDMPGVNGIDALKHLKSVERLASIPIVMATGRQEKEIVVQCVKAGAASYVVKPFEKSALRDKVEELLAIR